MGTNFYHRINICSECRRYDERHIGKSSVGWQFSFKGWKDSEGRPAIKSWQDWKYILKTFKDGQIFDEYGKEWSYDDFIAKVENTKGKQNHYDYLRDAPQYDYLRDAPQYGSSYLQDSWKDTEGWDFTWEGFR